MKQFLIILTLIFALTGTAFSGSQCEPPNTNNNDNRNTNTNLNTNVNSNKVDVGVNNDIHQGQTQGQQQKQAQGQLQGQTLINQPDQKIKQANTQTVLFEAPPVQLPNIAAGGSVPELNFGQGRMYDTTKSLPKFAIFGIKPLGTNDLITEVLNVNANVKFKNLYKDILEDAKNIANGGKKTLSDVRYQVIRSEAQKSWHTGGTLGGGGSGVGSTGLLGGSVGGSVVPSFGGTKADDLFTIIFVRVVN